MQYNSIIGIFVQLSFFFSIFVQNKNIMNVSIFIPCCIDQFTPQTGKNLISLLERLGHSVDYNPEQTCCGRLLYDNGNCQ